MEISLQQAIDFNFFDRYLKMLSEGIDPFEQDEDGRTAVHAIASLQQNTSALNFLSKKKSPYAYLIELNQYLSPQKLTVQDKNGETAIHTAIRHENWDIAAILGRQIYVGWHSNFRDNRSGVNELELCFILYGTEGRIGEMREVFPQESMLLQENFLDRISYAKKAFSKINIQKN